MVSRQVIAGTEAFRGEYPLKWIVKKAVKG